MSGFGVTRRISSGEPWCKGYALWPQQSAAVAGDKDRVIGHFTVWTCICSVPLKPTDSAKHLTTILTFTHSRNRPSGIEYLGAVWLLGVTPMAIGGNLRLSILPRGTLTYWLQGLVINPKLLWSCVLGCVISVVCAWIVYLHALVLTFMCSCFWVNGQILPGQLHLRRRPLKHYCLRRYCSSLSRGLKGQ